MSRENMHAAKETIDEDFVSLINKCLLLKDKAKIMYMCALWAVLGYMYNSAWSVLELFFFNYMLSDGLFLCRGFMFIRRHSKQWSTLTLVSCNISSLTPSLSPFLSPSLSPSLPLLFLPLPLLSPSLPPFPPSLSSLLGLHAHQFVEKSYKSFTYCGECEGFIWGLAKQGVQCESE